MAVTLRIRSDLDRLAKDLTDLEQRQIPFARAMTVNGLARDVAAAETRQLAQTFDTPTPFTLKGVGTTKATKANPVASVFIKDRQAAYLQPYAAGGLQVLGRKRAILTPIGVNLNRYGNIPRGKLVALKGQPGVFVGSVKTKAGKSISGVWRRVDAAPGGKRRARRGVHTPKGPLKLLIEFTDPKSVTKRFPFDQVARATVAKALGPRWNEAIAAALASAK